MIQLLHILDTSTLEWPSSSSGSQFAETSIPPPGQKNCKEGVTLSSIPKLVDNKRRHMEKTISQAQRE